MKRKLAEVVRFPSFHIDGVWKICLAYMQDDLFKMFENTCFQGEIEDAKWILGLGVQSLWQADCFDLTFLTIGRYGDAAMFQFIQSLGYQCPKNYLSEITCAAARSTNIDMLSLVLESEFFSHDMWLTIFADAFQDENLVIVDFLIQNVVRQQAKKFVIPLNIPQAIISQIAKNASSALLLRLIEFLPKEENWAAILQRLCMDLNFNALDGLLKRGYFANISHEHAIIVFRNIAHLRHVHMLQWLLSNIQSTQFAVDSTFHEACRSQNVEVVRFLTTSPLVSIYISDAQKTKTFIILCRGNFLASIRILLSSLKIPNIASGLRQACLCNHFDLIRLLLKHQDLFTDGAIIDCFMEVCKLRFFDIGYILFKSQRISNVFIASFLTQECLKGDVELVRFLLSLANVQSLISLEWILSHEIQNKDAIVALLS